NADAAHFSEVLVLAVPFGAVDCALTETGPLDGQVVWSCVNALKHDLSGLAVGFTTSAAEEVARRIPTAHVVAAIPPFAQTIAASRARQRVLDRDEVGHRRRRQSVDRLRQPYAAPTRRGARKAAGGRPAHAVPSGSLRRAHGADRRRRRADHRAAGRTRRHPP